VVEVKTGGHWLTFATKYGAEHVLDVLGGGHGGAENMWAFGHPKRVVHESGTVVHFGSPRDDQPTVVNLPGETCEGYYSDGLDWAEKLSGWVTRTDLALDLEPAESARARLVQMVTAWRRGRVETRMRRDSCKLFQNDNPAEGWTAYFGGASADLKLRAYDKRGPLRLEWQWRPHRDLGVLLPDMIRKNGPAGLWRRLSLAAVWPMPWYRELLDDGAERLPRAEEEETRFEEAIASVRSQLGVTLWALQLAGVKLADLAVDPVDKIRGDTAAKLLRWSREADRVSGYDGAKLRSEVSCRLKLKRKRM